MNNMEINFRKPLFLKKERVQYELTDNDLFYFTFDIPLIHTKDDRYLLNLKEIYRWSDFEIAEEIWLTTKSQSLLDWAFKDTTNHRNQIIVAKHGSIETLNYMLNRKDKVWEDVKDIIQRRLLNLEYINNLLK